MTAYYNEIDPYAAQWLRNLIAAGHIAPGDVDERSIIDVRPDDLRAYKQCHFFAGIGGWSYALRLAGIRDDTEVWTGSCPCQPFSVAGKGAGQADARHLWPEFHRLIRGCRPPVVMGEQVAAAVGKSWLDGVCSDLEGIGYTTGAAVVPACAVDAPHRRDRLWFVADNANARERRRGLLESCEGASPLEQRSSGEFAGSSSRHVADSRHNDGTAWTARSKHESGAPISERSAGDYPSPLGDGEGSQILLGKPGIARPQQSAAVGTSRRPFWSDSERVTGHDGKARRVKPGIRLLAHGIPARVGKLRAFGNAIVPQVAAEIIGAYFDARLTAL